MRCISSVWKVTTFCNYVWKVMRVPCAATLYSNAWLSRPYKAAERRVFQPFFIKKMYAYTLSSYRREINHVPNFVVSTPSWSLAPCQTMKWNRKCSKILEHRNGGLIFSVISHAGDYNESHGKEQKCERFSLQNFHVQLTCTSWLRKPRYWNRTEVATNNFSKTRGRSNLHDIGVKNLIWENGLPFR